MTNTSWQKFNEEQLQFLDEIFVLAPGEDIERERFFNMALETYASLARSERYIGAYNIHPEYASNFLNQENKHGLMPQLLLERWQKWEEDLPALLSRNPKLEMYYMLQAIGESICGPFLDEPIQDWLDRGRRLPLPFEDRQGIATEGFYQKFRALRSQVNGWVSYPPPIFYPETEWQSLRAARREEALRWQALQK